MQRNFIFIAVMAFFSFGISKDAHAEDILVLMSIKTSGYQDVLNSAHNSCIGASSKVVVLSDSAEVNIPQLLRSTRAKVILAVGDRAYKLALSTVQRTPVIGALVLDQKQNTISYLAPPEKYLVAMKKLGRKQIGVVYGKNLAPYVRRAAEMAKEYGITLVRRDASTTAEAMNKFVSFNGQVDGFWILPDSAVLTAGAAETTLKLAQERNIPVFAFSSTYLKSGAAVVIEPDRYLIGREIGEGLCAVIKDVAYITPINKDVYREVGNDLIFDRLQLPKKPFFNVSALP